MAEKNLFFSFLINNIGYQASIFTCLDSLLAQEGQEELNYEIIVGDRSEEKDYEILKKEIHEKYGNKVTLFHNKDEGPLILRLKLISRAEGKYINFIESGDYVETSYLKNLRYILEVNQFPEMMVVNYSYPVHKGKVERRSSPIIPPEKNAKTYLLYNNHFDSLSRLVFLRELFNADDYGNFNFKSRYGEERLFAYPLIKHCKDVIIDNDVCYYHHTSDPLNKYRNLTIDDIYDLLFAYQSNGIDIPNKKEINKIHVPSFLQELSFCLHFCKEKNESKIKNLLIDCRNELEKCPISNDELDLVNKKRLKNLLSNQFEIFHHSSLSRKTIAKPLTKKQKSLLYGGIALASLFVSVAFAAGGGSRLDFVRHDAYAQIVCNHSKSNYESRVYSSLHSGNDNVTKYFRSAYPLNFSSTQYYNTVLMSCNVENGDYSFVTTELSCAGSTFDNIALCDGNTYTNKNMKFETLNINLYKTPNREEERYFPTEFADGFVYLPDYMADQIIDQDPNDKISTYLDLLPDLSKEQSEEKKKEFLEKYAVKIKDKNGRIIRLKIANIFHIKGFSKDLDYKYTDAGAGQKLENFLGKYVVAYSPLIDKYYERGLLTIYEPKRFISSYEIGKSATYSGGSSNMYLKFYQFDNSFNRSDMLILNSQSYIPLSGADAAVTFLLLLGSVATLVLSLIYDYKYYQLNHSWKKLLFSFIPWIAFFFTFHLFYLTFLKNNLYYLITYNIIIGVPVAIYVVCSLIFKIVGNKK